MVPSVVVGYKTGWLWNTSGEVVQNPHFIYY